MKVYITNQTKKEIEDKITALETAKTSNERDEGFRLGRLGRLKELNKLLNTAVILPFQPSGDFIIYHH
jgi:hypothetical protein